MANTVLLVAGATALSSDPFTLADGESATLFVYSSKGSRYGLALEWQNENEDWVFAETISGVRVLTAAGTWRLTRTARAGVDIGAERGA